MNDAVRAIFTASGLREIMVIAAWQSILDPSSRSSELVLASFPALCLQIIRSVILYRGMHTVAPSVYYFIAISIARDFSVFGVYTRDKACETVRTCGSNRNENRK